MKKFKKLISTVTLVAFCTLSYSPAFASVAAEQPVMDECVPQEITEIIVKDPETKAWLESEESPYSDIPVTLVDEFPADVEAEFDAMLSSTDDVEAAAVPGDGVEPAYAVPLAIPLAQWLSASAYALLAGAFLTFWAYGMEFAEVKDVAKEMEKDDAPDYYATNFDLDAGKVFIGDAISSTEAVNILDTSVKLGRNSDVVGSWKNIGNVMCKDYNTALGLCSMYQAVTLGTISNPEKHGETECGYYAHFHVGAPNVDISKKSNRSAHVWFLMYPAGAFSL